MYTYMIHKIKTYDKLRDISSIYNMISIHYIVSFIVSKNPYRSTRKIIPLFKWANDMNRSVKKKKYEWPINIQKLILSQ